jgi:hypothetical protein
VSNVIVTAEVPPLPFDARLTPELEAKAKQIRWQWYLLYNRARSAPRTPTNDGHLECCDEAIAIIDAILAANAQAH